MKWCGKIVEGWAVMTASIRISLGVAGKKDGKDLQGVIAAEGVTTRIMIRILKIIKI